MLMKKSLLVILALSFAAISSGCTRGGTKTISGKVELAPGVEAKLAPTAVLYIIARDASANAGPPIAVKRITQPLQFPVSFELTAADAMIPNTPFEGEMALTARVSQRGSAGPATSGDIEGAARKNPVEVGDDSVSIELNQVRQ